MFEWGGFYSGGIGDLLNKWEQMGVFSYVLPFLMIFALVSGILAKSNIFDKNKVVNTILALAVSLMALQFEFVPRFFSEVFPRFGIGLAVILILLIFIGLFTDNNSGWQKIVLMVVGVIIVIVVLVSTSGALGWASGSFINEQWGELAFWIIIIALVVLIAFFSGGKAKEKSYNVVRAP